MEWFWIGLMMAEAAQQHEDIEDSSWYGPIECCERYKPTKMNLFMKKHPIIDETWPYVLGVTAGLLPLIISMVLWMLGN